MTGHIHDWRRSPRGDYRVNDDTTISLSLACASCPARAWGKQPQRVVDWPAWGGPVEDVVHDIKSLV